MPFWCLMPSDSLASSTISTTSKRPIGLKGSYTFRVCRQRANYRPLAALRAGHHRAYREHQRHRSRKRFGYRTPEECFYGALELLQFKVETKRHELRVVEPPDALNLVSGQAAHGALYVLLPHRRRIVHGVNTLPVLHGFGQVRRLKTPALREAVIDVVEQFVVANANDDVIFVGFDSDVRKRLHAVQPLLDGSFYHFPSPSRAA